jgi:hypothetical protein
MYVFGGEFTSPNQEKFHHFKVGGGCHPKPAQHCMANMGVANA